MQTVSRGMLEEVAEMRPFTSPRGRGKTGAHRREEGVGFGLRRWIEQHGVPVKREGEWDKDGYRYVLEECPWNGHTDGAAYVVQFANGAIAAGCHHNSCEGYDWPDLREHYEPGCYDGLAEVIRLPGHDTPSYAASRPADWPTLGEEAYYGVVGDIVRIIEPNTEADPAGLLVSYLVAYGNAIGRGSYFNVEADKHYLKIFAGIVGDSSKSRKGTMLGHVKKGMRVTEPGWVDKCWVSGLSSGEGLINRVRNRSGDGEEETEEDDLFYEAIERPTDKRLMVIESELAQIHKAMGRQGNTLSPAIRAAWDDSPLEILTRNDPIKATGSHISIIGHITIEELVRSLNAVEMANGFANRFLWILVQRSKNLPFGASPDEANFAPRTDRLRQAIEFGKKAGRIAWGESAKDPWAAVYSALSEGKPGLLGALTARAEAQVVRLAAIYALLDLSKTIEFEHLLAALAVWQYAEESTRYIFGDATGDPNADQIEAALRENTSGLSRTQISNIFGRNLKAERIDQALRLLLNTRRARKAEEDTGGRRAERWFAM